MDANDTQQIADALDETLDLLSGDAVVAVSPDGGGDRVPVDCHVGGLGHGRRE